MQTDPAKTNSAIGDKMKLSAQLCFAVYSTMHGVSKVYRGLLKDLGLTYPQYLVMLVLWEHDRINVSEICNALGLETTTLTPLLKRMEKRGLIRRQRSAEDERQVIVSLTDEGLAMREKARDIPDCMAAATGQSETEIAELRQQLNGIRASLNRLG
ncbi:MarR family transcriptional regulator [Nitratireductor sp. XY-223]|uniref:MarR family winged helix-turn-helix transcriptional regulator n=1 Tax=Nitratireductor sp. XY-223 TaxID=2561926 RepID=UPI0010A9EDE7|nr:MarR family transcriptional regulator [Nitratireductor sp. XY-223]